MAKEKDGDVKESEEKTERPAAPLRDTRNTIVKVEEAHPDSVLSKVYAGVRLNVFKKGNGFSWEVKGIGSSENVSSSAKEAGIAAQRAIDASFRQKK